MSGERTPTRRSMASCRRKEERMHLEAYAPQSNSVMDPELLINEVYVRPPLWDRLNPAHSNRDIISNLWKEVADACSVSCDAARAKWKHLRDHFRCELKRCLKSQSGSKSGRYKSTWVWFWPLFFLKEQMLISQDRHRKAEEEEDSLAEGADEESSAGADDPASGSGVTPDVEAPDIKRVLPLRLAYKRRRSDPLDIEYGRRLNKALQGDYDDTEHFVLSLVPALRTLPHVRQMYVRLKIQELVSNEAIAHQETRAAEAVAAASVAAMDGTAVVEAALGIADINHTWTTHGADAGSGGGEGPETKCELPQNWQTDDK